MENMLQSGIVDEHEHGERSAGGDGDVIGHTLQDLLLLRIDGHRMRDRRDHAFAHAQDQQQSDHEYGMEKSNAISPGRE